MGFYYRFCSTIHFFFDKKMRLSDPSIFSILFISMIEYFYILGGYYFICIFLSRRIYEFKFYMFATLGIITLMNFFLIYRKAKQYDYYSNRVNTFFAIILIVLGYAVMGLGGQMYPQFFLNK